MGQHTGSGWPWHGRLALFLIGLSETKPREMNEAHSWLRNPCEGLKHEQLRSRKAALAAVCGMAKISSWGRGALASAGKHQVLGSQALCWLLTPHLGWLSPVPWQVWGCGTARMSPGHLSASPCPLCRLGVTSGERCLSASWVNPCSATAPPGWFLGV